jgi:hypothetical protein
VPKAAGFGALNRRNTLIFAENVLYWAQSDEKPAKTNAR